MPGRPVLAALAAALALVPAASAHPLGARGFDAPKESATKRVPAVFVMPLDGPVYSNFGYRWGRMHSGVDIAVLGTDAVRAALPGVVTSVGYLANYSGYGNVVRIRHPGGLETMYAHLASASVRVGERVEAGQLIARAGCTGSCTGTHLHFEVRVRGRVVDPMRFLRKNAVR